MNCLGINSFSDGIAVTILFEEQLISHIFKSPKVFGKEETNLMLDMHRNNIVSLVYKYQIDTISLKQVENSSFTQRRGLTDGQRNQLYLEGMIFSLAGFLGLKCKFYQKVNIKRIVDQNIDQLDVYDLISDQFQFNIDSVDTEDEHVVKSTLAVACAVMEN